MTLKQFMRQRKATKKSMKLLDTEQWVEAANNLNVTTNKFINLKNKKHGK